MVKLNSRQILTIGVGKQLYLDLALNLARSFLYWHPLSEIKFTLVTDQPDDIPAAIRSMIDVIKILPGQYGTGFSPKLYLNELAADGQTLFIDSDCLIFEPLDKLFELFRGHDVSVVGGFIAHGEWFGNIAAVCKQMNVPHLPKFNGGLYYLEKGTCADQVFQTARKLEKKYDELGFLRLRGRPNDEVLMAVAMQLHGQEPIKDDGTIMSDPQACPGPYVADILSGRRVLTNPPPPSPLHCSWYLFKNVSPAIIHFLGHHIEAYTYRRETYRLQNLEGRKLGLYYRMQAKVSIECPSRIKLAIKNLFRPLYKAFFIDRKIRSSSRIT